MSEDKILNQQEVAEKCHVHYRTIGNWVGGANPDFPKGFKYNKGTTSPRFWRESVILEYIKTQEQAAA